MFKYIKWFILAIFLLSSLCIAEETVTTSKGKQVLLKDDHTWEYIDNQDSNQNVETSPSPTPKPIDAKYAEEAVEIWKAYLELGKHNNNDAVYLHLDYKNNTAKKIVGITVSVKITNPFGKVAYENTFEDEIVGEPLGQFRDDTSWYFIDNPFITDEPYDRLSVIAKNGTAKIKTKILKVIFEDGTILKSKPTQQPPVTRNTSLRKN